MRPLGFKHSEETKLKMRNTRLERKKLLGFINSPESREKMSKTRKGVSRGPFSDEIKKRMSESRKGIIFTEEHRRHISEGGKFPKPWLRGENSRFWKGGKSSLIKRIKAIYEYKIWRESIFKRDNWTCKKCNRRGSLLLHPHHKKAISDIIKENNIKTVDEALKCPLIWDISNGETLCHKCHKETDNYGWKRYNKEI